MDTAQYSRSLCSWNIPKVLFGLLLAVFVFRNCYFLVDVDSHSTYLFTQKLWLHTGSSLQGDVARDMRIFVPHFDAVPYALGISFFGTETLFPQWVVVSWTILAMLFVFSYASYRFSSWYGLAAAMFVAFDQHVFFSGANQCCVINGAVICFLFAAGYNFWEARQKNSLFRFLLAIIFLSHLMANKYQLAYTLIFIGVVGIVIQQDIRKKIIGIVTNRKYLSAFLAGIFFVSLWYLKNYLITGVPTFPILADRFHAFNWSPGLADTFNKVFPNGLNVNLLLKYFNYLFIWPGINASKLVIISISLLPLAVLGAKTLKQDALFELGYWQIMSVLYIVGLCMVTFPDPRHYRYGIAIFSFTAVVFIDYVFQHGCPIKPKAFATLVLLLLALMGSRIVLQQGGNNKYPFFKDNVAVIFNKLHFADVVERYYPLNKFASEGFYAHREQASQSAWDTGVAGVMANPLSAFLLPIAPQVGLWHTTVVQWESYESQERIKQDLQNYGIQWIMRVENDELQFLSTQEYAKEAVLYNRFPKTRFYNYGFPAELSDIKY